MSLAFKLLAIRLVRSSGYQRLVAHHGPQHPPINMSRRLGFLDHDSQSATPTPNTASPQPR